MMQVGDVLSQGVSAQFDRAAASYDEAAEVQVQVADGLLARLQPLALQPRRVLDLGSGTGYCAERLLQQFPQADVFAMDASLRMLAQHYQRCSQSALVSIGGDCHHMPFLPGSFDLIVSNMVLHWCQDVAAVLREVQALLSPQGVFVFSMAGPDTFHEWRAAWQSIDQDAHVLPFVAPPQLAQWLMSSGFKDVVLDSECWVVAYPSMADIHAAMKRGGACMPRAARQGLRGRDVYHRLCEAYACYRDDAGYLPLSYDVSFAYARQGRDDVTSGDQRSYVPVDKIVRM